MPGKILKVLTSVGAPVKKGDILLVLEAMKMENEIFSDVDGTVTQLRVRDGDAVNSGDALVVIG
jgi:biotin carboxyl carrier protein